MNNDRKMLKESCEILDVTLNRISQSKVSFLLISGDLTKDGEKKSHEESASKPKQLPAKGIKVFVVPGNHDVNNPHAKSFLNGMSAIAERKTENITAVNAPTIPAGTSFRDFAFNAIVDGAKHIAISMLSKPEIISQILPADMPQDMKDQLLSNPAIGLALTSIKVD